MPSASPDPKREPERKKTPIWVVEDSAYEALKAEQWLETCDSFERSGLHLPHGFYSRFPVAWRGYSVYPRRVYRRSRQLQKITRVLNPAWKRPPDWKLDTDEEKKKGS